jgi:prevent-host-death family protein
MPASVLEGIFGDDMVTATDLNRRAGEVLNRARLNPVTISRNNEQFALMPREQVAQLIKGYACLRRSVDLIGAAWKCSLNAQVPASCEWLAAFDEEDLQEMAREILSAIERSADSGDWAKVDSVIHEWRESASAIASGVLKEAISSETDETPIEPPKVVSQSDATSAESAA